MSILQATKLDEAALKTSNLVYSYEEPPGIRRIRRGRGFSFVRADGQTISEKEERQRLLDLAVPPTYENVWYCPTPNGHLQATGLDSKQNKQYFYHSAWETLRDAHKFSIMKDFGEALPTFRRRISKDLKVAAHDKNTVLAAMARVLDRTGIRIGSDSATKENKTYGLTTLLKKQFDHEGNGIHLEYQGKGGVDLEHEFYDPKVAAVLDQCEDIPGKRLFEYEDDNGNPHTVSSTELNNFLKENIGEVFSAKDFRTWRFSCLFLEEALRLYNHDKDVTLKQALGNVAETSGNTPSVLQSSYVHPGLIKIVKDADWTRFENVKTEHSGLRKAENIFLNYLGTRHAAQALLAKTEQS